MKRKTFFALSALSLMISCTNDYTAYVDSMIGTGGHGHTFPGASMPNGMVQLSPDTRLVGWEACSGYHVTDETIIGFTHTHLNGTGIGDMGDILLMPTVGCDKITPGVDTVVRSGYRSRFSHENEVATPGYYSVFLDDYKVNVELTTTMRAGMHRYTFPASEEAAIMLDIHHSLMKHSNTEAFLEIVDDTHVKGMRNTKGWAKNQPVYFYAEFSKPFVAEVYSADKLQSVTSLKGKNLKARLKFHTKSNEQVLVKVGISAVDINGAKANLYDEIHGWDFDKIVKTAKNAWNKRLSKIEVETSDETSKRIFYTSLYHAMLSPIIFTDSDNRYLGQDLKIHTSEDGLYYTVFSLWDTFGIQTDLN